MDFKTPLVHDASMPVTQGGRSDQVGIPSHLLLGRYFSRPSHQVSGENMSGCEHRNIERRSREGETILICVDCREEPPWTDDYKEQRLREAKE